MAKEFQPFPEICIQQQASSLVFESMDKEITPPQTTPSQAAAPPSKTEPESSRGGCKTAAWSLISDGIITICSTPSEIMKNVDEHIDNVLYGTGKPHRRLPVFEEISPSFDIDELMKMQIEFFQYAFSGF